MDIKTKIKKSIALSEDVKVKLLSIKSKLPSKFEKYLLDFLHKEENILKDISNQIPNIYLKTLQDIENLEREKEKQNLSDLERQLQSV